MIRSFRDRDYLETEEGFFFTVVGNIHPKDRVIAYLKNIPSQSGKWGSGERRYERALKYYTMNCLTETLKFLVEHYPHYVQRLETEKITFSSVPLNRIRKHYPPEEGLATLLRRKHLDALQKKTIDLFNHAQLTVGAKPYTPTWENFSRDSETQRIQEQDHSTR